MPRAELSETDKTKLKDLNGQIATLQAQLPGQVAGAAADANAVIGVGTRPSWMGSPTRKSRSPRTQPRRASWTANMSSSCANTTQQPILASLKNRSLRERVLKASEMRERLQAGPTDLRDLIATHWRSCARRRGKLLGFADFADYTLTDQMAKNSGGGEKAADRSGAGDDGQGQGRGSPKSRR